MFKSGDIVELLPREILGWSKEFYEDCIKSDGSNLFEVMRDEELSQKTILLKNSKGGLVPFCKDFFRLYKTVDEIVHIDNSYVNNTIDDEIKPGDWVEIINEDTIKSGWCNKYGKVFKVIKSDYDWVKVEHKSHGPFSFKRTSVKKIPNPNTISSKTIDNMETNFEVGDIVSSYYYPKGLFKIVSIKKEKAKNKKYVEVIEINSTYNPAPKAAFWIKDIKLFKKHNENVQTNEKVSGSSSIEGNGQRKTGRAITSSSRSSIATGSRLVGNEKRAFSQQSRTGQGQIVFSPKHAYGN